MMSVKFSKDVHFVNKSKVTGSIGLVLRIEDTHEVLCGGEKNAIENTTTNEKEVTCPFCTEILSMSIDEYYDKVYLKSKEA